MKPNRRLAIVPVLAALLLGVVAGSFPTALAQDNEDEGVTFDTEDSFYMPGDLVVFIGSGYSEGCQYSITVDGVEVGPLSGTPQGLTNAAWQTESATPTGTYLATIWNVTDPGQHDELASVHFGIWGTDKTEYTYPDVVTISGGGGGAARPLTINITNGTWVPAGYPKDISADGNGEFLDGWDFYDASTGRYTITVNGTGTVDDEEEKFRLETTVELTVTAAGRAESIRQEIDDKMLEIQGAVDEGKIADIDGALIAKLTVISDKIQQAIDWLGTSRDKVARNMLNAARNKLKAFINQVRAQRGKHIIDTDLADGLIEQAEHLLELIEGLIGSFDEGQTAQPVLSQTEGKGNGKGNNGKGNGKGKGKGKPQ